ncbi:hypothetical protein KQX54_006985 [Cotesia glomerata]|uniref:Uncharacterized protein n=1 Tax=Cotesia glomerata TaxID=32391 RepID=A0AAV7HVC2_COTGL|nr:hypothetical protein KQX54_006985 [Cotesia glomerata]
MRAASRSPSDVGLVSNEDGVCFLSRATASIKDYCGSNESGESASSVEEMAGSSQARSQLELHLAWPRFSGLSQPGRAIPPKGVINKLGRC